MIAEVIINSTVKSLNKTFDYEVPKNLKVEIGSRVFIPFGKSKNPEEGIVVGLKEKSEFKVKEILKLQAEKIEKGQLWLYQNRPNIFGHYKTDYPQNGFFYLPN